jgi:3,2-trans-enoyl-CoA isomerase
LIPKISQLVGIFRCQAISQSIKEIEQSKKIQSLVLASSIPTILSAGLDLLEMHKPDQKRLPEFWKSFQQVYLDLYGSRLACIAAIEGHAPAAGCMLALACDYRVMAATEGSFKPTIGLNESKFGIVAPPWLGELMVLTIGHRPAEKALALGTLFSPEDALEIGLVDEVVPKEQVLEKAKEEAIKWAKIPPQARVASKMLTRKKQLDHLIATRQADVDNFVGFATQDIVQKNLSLYLESLKKK